MLSSKPLCAQHASCSGRPVRHIDTFRHSCRASARTRCSVRSPSRPVPYSILGFPPVPFTHGLARRARQCQGLPDHLQPGGQEKSSAPIAAAAAASQEEQQNVALRIAQLVPEPAWWAAVPAASKLLIANTLAFTICQMDKINLSVSLVPMASEFSWSPTLTGLLSSSFFCGYLLFQLPGGLLATKYGGRRVLPIGLACWSVVTALIPLAAAEPGGLCFARALVGLGEAVAPSAAVDMVTRVVGKEEKGRAMSMVYAGLQLGSIVGLVAGPVIIEAFGWRSIFVAFGMAGLLWVGWFESLVVSCQATAPEVAAKLEQQVDSHNSSTPLRGFLRTRAVQALMYTHLCHNWFQYTMLAWLPSYFTQTQGTDLLHAGSIAMVPNLASMAASYLAGFSADALLARGCKVSTVRKLSQAIAFLGPVACLAGVVAQPDQSDMAVPLIIAAMGLSSFSVAGLYCNHSDLSPKHASALLGLTNTAGTLPGIVGVALTGYLLDQTHDWNTALFMPSMAFFCSGALVFSLFGESSAVDLEAPHLNTPFAWEALLPGRRAAAAKDRRDNA